ncbi:hypothetical protein LguiA_003051 [Lonicera macranthoides]
MLITAVATPWISLGPSHCHGCHAEGIGCSTSYGITSGWIKNPCEVQRLADHSGIRFSGDNSYSGAMQFHWLPLGRGTCLSKVSVAADYSDSMPDSSNYVGNNGYHPLEELKDWKQVRNTKLTSAEIAKTTVEANSSALLIFPGMVHCEPHEHISWDQYRYVIDDYGDIFFEIPDDENILEDRGASNPVNVLIGMDLPLIESRRVAAGGYRILESGFSDDIPYNEDYYEVDNDEIFDTPVDWGIPDTSSRIHAIYFAKSLTKAFNREYSKKMDYPSNGVSILGCLRPTFVDEELYLRRLFSGEDSDGYTSDWSDDELLRSYNEDDGNFSGSTIHRLEIMRIELFSVYGVRSSISLQDFRDAEPDVLVHSTPVFVERFIEKGTMSDFALRALCKKKGLHVEGANLIGVDSLGMDVRVFSGTEVQTHRFPFKVRATSERAAEKQIQQLLFPRSRRKKAIGSHLDALSDADHQHF